jgi:hypothetical protein
MSLPTVCCTSFTRIGIGSIPDFLWLGVKLLVWLVTFLSSITCVANVQMAHVRPFSTSTLQGLFNDIKNISRRGVLISAIELWNCGSPRGLQVPTFGSVSFIFTLAEKWGCDTLGILNGYKSNIGFPWYKVVKNMGFNVIGYIITRCGCSSLVPIQQTSGFITFSLVPIH